MESSSSLRPSSLAITLVTAGTLVTGVLAYAAYFDHRRRTDPAFRKTIRKEYKELAKQQKVESKSQIEKVKKLVGQINEEGFPLGNDEEVEEYFLRYLSQADKAQGCKLITLCHDSILTNGK
jgi:mitochondrial import receptor subunit TOM20